MEILNIDGSNKNPQVNCNAKTGILEFSGMSYADSTFLFYEPIFNWVNEYARNPAPLTILNMKIKYFNTSAVKCIFDILETVTNISNTNNQVQINWFYEDEDEEMKATGENFSNILKHKFNIEVMIS